MTDMTTGSGPPANPLQLSLASPDGIARWRPLVHWFLVIPQWIVAYVLLAVAGILQIAAFFTVIFTRQVPKSIYDFIVMAHRYSWRIFSYALFMRESYPPFAFELLDDDPGDDPAILSMAPPVMLNRWLPLVKWLLLIPQYIVVFFLLIGVYVVSIVAFFGVIFTGKWPEGMKRFVIGVVRWSARVSMYQYFLTDVYPPFSLD